MVRIIFRNVIAIFAGLALTVLGLRVVFRLLGLPVSNNFVGWVYDLGNLLITPLNHVIILPNIQIGQGRVIDLNACLALLLYAVVASVLLGAVNRRVRAKR